MVRRAVPEECAAVAALIQAAFAEYRGRLEPESGALRETAETIAAAFGDHRVLVAESGARLVGCVLAKRDGDALYLGRLSVHPDFRHRGIADRLLAEIGEQARAIGIRALTVGVRISLPGNLRFFEAHGFREIGREAHPGFDHPTSINLAKRL